jgi:hypothetical protein
MQFIEQLLGVSPDGGTGLTEVALAAAVVSGALLALARRLMLRRRHAAAEE